MSKGSTGQTSSGSQTQTTTKELPSWATGTAMTLLGKASNESSAPYASYPYVVKYDASGNPSSYYNTVTGESKSLSENLETTSTIASQSDATKTALEGLISKALSGNPVSSSATQLESDTLSGKYLSPDTNPYLSDTYDAAANKVTDKYLNSTTPQLAAAAERSGAFGGSADALLKAQSMQDYGQTLSDLATTLYGNNYNNERNNQLKALALSPTVGSEYYSDLKTLLGAGQTQDTYNQSVLSDLASQWSSESKYPSSQLSSLASILSQATNGTGSTTTTSSSSTPSNSTLSDLLSGIATGTGTGLMASGSGMSDSLSSALGFAALLGSIF